MLTVELHRLLGCPLTVTFVLVLDLLHERLESAHGLNLAALLDRQGDHHHPDQQRESDDGNAKIRQEVVVKQNQSVDHRLDDHEVPSI